MPVSVTLDDVSQGITGYQVEFSGGQTSCVEQYDDLAVYANDVLERHAEEVFRAILILRWLEAGRLSETVSMSDAGRVTISG